MTEDKMIVEMRKIMRISQVGMLVNILLAIIKLAVGYNVNSLGLIADGYNSFFDIFTDVAVVLGAMIGVKPADRDHPFGHGKIETLTAVIVNIALIGLGLGIIYSAVTALRQPAQNVNGIWVIVVALVTLLLKDRLYRITQRIAVECRSTALEANAWNHRTDALLALMVFTGGLSALLNFPQGDKIAGLLVGIFIFLVGLRLLYKALFELSEGSPGEDTEQSITALIGSFEEVKGWHKLRVRRLGRELMMDIHILLDADLSVKDGHDIVKRIEAQVQSKLSWPVNLTIHIDPTTEEIINARKAAGDKTLRL